LEYVKENPDAEDPSLDIESMEKILEANALVKEEKRKKEEEQKNKKGNEDLKDDFGFE
jgi:hypothetical protein